MFLFSRALDRCARAGRVGEALPDIDTPWRLEARLLADMREWTFPSAYDRVLVRYLLHGHCGPLVDLILRQRRAPGLAESQYIAAMIDRGLRSQFREPNFPFEIGFDQNRRRGRPANGHIAVSKEALSHLFAGLGLLGEGRMPAMPFWDTLAGALAVESHKRGTMPGLRGTVEFPLKAKLVRADRRKVHGQNPELPMRDFLIATAMAEKMEQGLKYDQAKSDVLRDIDRQAAVENWKGPRFGEETVRKAYDTAARRKSS
jgi:hypothetical protein